MDTADMRRSHRRASLPSVNARNAEHREGRVADPQCRVSRTEAPGENGYGRDFRYSRAPAAGDLPPVSTPEPGLCQEMENLAGE